MDIILSGAGVGVNGTAKTIVVGVHGQITLVAWGTFSATTVRLQVSPDQGTTWVNVTNASFTAAGHLTLAMASGSYVVRGTTTGGTAPSVSLAIRY